MVLRGTEAAMPTDPALFGPAAVPPAANGVLVAFSGGLDSTVLLHRLAGLAVPGLRAVHVHHGLQVAADQWAAHCIAFAASLGVSCEVRRVVIDPRDAAGPEAAARAARYGALRDALRTNELLATGHHRDDQAETVLLQLLRGSGLRGLGAMQTLIDFAPGRLWRPLLGIPRAALRDYAERHRLEGLEDPHNQDPRYARSWLRREILPQLRSRFPQADATLARAAAHAEEAAGLLGELAAIDRADPAHAAGPAGSLSVAALLRLSPPRRRNLLRSWLRAGGFATPEAAMLIRVDHELLAARADAEPLLGWSGCELRRYRDALFAMSPLPAPPAADWRTGWQDGDRLALPPGCGALVADAPPPRMLTVRLARAGERLRLQPLAPSRTIKNLYQEHALPPWLRQRMPVIECDGAAAMLPALGLSTPAALPLAQAGWRVRWIAALPGLQ